MQNALELKIRRCESHFKVLKLFSERALSYCVLNMVVHNLNVFYDNISAAQACDIKRVGSISTWGNEIVNIFVW